MDGDTVPRQSEADWLREQARVGLEEIQRGEFIEEDEMAMRVERMLRTTLTRGQEL